ncbi:hypothetical protein HYH03_005642 [Edaphochlamys debaryana]|uniref:Pseudouridine synthase RsuA/RluA-like domain-containing protein n=1 Tax=Edaphochlamys debaryana TaxID=47281 RepID=A0A835Y8Z3_9CHLO|nr:hypothetical protein HYH03_005642 [Edaphochlamys debaryana]|eukprot:KAG2496416.1 hypothetical protein HYH03_005642 [Edaphochlamys debaryana]
MAAMTSSSSSVAVPPSIPLPAPPQRMPKVLVVAAEAQVPSSVPPASPLLDLLPSLMPGELPTPSAARRALRKRLVLHFTAASASGQPSCSAPEPAGGPAARAPDPHGTPASVLTRVDPGDRLQLITRAGCGYGSSMDVAGSTEQLGKQKERQQSEAAGLAEWGAGHDGSALTVRHAGPLVVVYEDEHLAVVIKPPGMATQGSGPSTVQGLLQSCLAPTCALGALSRPRQAHRLDGPTGGLLLAAKTHTALRGLTRDLAEGRVKKRYCAIVKGERAGSGVIDLHLSGKQAVTAWRVVGSVECAPLPSTWVPSAAGPGPGSEPGSGSGPGPAAAGSGPEGPAGPGPLHSAGSGRRVLTKVLLWPHTGRNHQLRRHMAATGTPMLGDPRYRTARAAATGAEAAGEAPVQHTGTGGSAGAEASSRDPSTGISSRDLWGGSDGVEGEAAWVLVRPPPDAAWALAAAEAAAAAGTSRVAAGSSGRSGLSGGGGGGGGGEGGSLEQGEAEEAEEGEEAADGASDSDGGGVSDASGASESGGLSGSRSRGVVGRVVCSGDVLADGQPVSLCLWAVGLRFRHPVTGQGVEVDAGGWADAVYDSVLRRAACGGRWQGMWRLDSGVMPPAT